MWYAYFHERNKKYSGKESENLWNSCRPVSYTHLDVYKRQGVLCGNESDYGGKFYGVYRIRWQSDTGKPVYL